MSASHAAMHAHELGFKVVGVSDIDGGLYNANWSRYSRHSRMGRRTSDIGWL